MPGYRGRRVHIIELLDKEPVEVYTGRWEQRVKLECGHVAKVIASSRNHRRARPIKAAFCTHCPPKEKP